MKSITSRTLLLLALLISFAQATPENDNATALASWINTASAEEFQEVKGIGPVLSARLVAYRASQPGGKFASVYDLSAVKGIGEKKIQAMSDYVRSIK